MSRSSQLNLMLAVVVGIVSATLVGARLARDPSGASAQTTPTRFPPTTSPLPTPSTVIVGGIGEVGGTIPPGELLGPSTTTTSTVAAPPAPAPATTSTTRTTRVPATSAPATTVPNPGVIFTEVPGPSPTTTASPTTTVPVTVAPPPTTTTTSPTTTAPPTTQPPVTTTAPRGPLQLGIPPLFGLG